MLSEKVFSYLKKLLDKESFSLYFSKGILNKVKLASFCTRNGLVFIYNMSNSKYSNFDYDLSQKMLTLLKGKL